MPKKKKTPKTAIDWFEHNLKKKKFDFSRHLTPKEMAFVYDMVESKNRYRQFIATKAQTRYLMILRDKCDEKNICIWQ